jgi:uncharacterized membrane-anchored protein YhcB (DUF1043 family)
MNWLNRFLLINWSWLMDGMLLFMALIIGIQVGESRVQKEWNAEKSKNEQLAAKLEQHVADVKLMQNQINQEISNDFSKKSKLLAERMRDHHAVGVCHVDSSGASDLSSVSTTTGSVAETSSNDLPASPGHARDVSCEKLAEDAVQTTLMLIEMQHWYESHSKANK